MTAARRINHALCSALLWQATSAVLCLDNASLVSSARAETAGDWSVRVAGWSSDRIADEGSRLVNAEAWARGSVDLGPDVTIRGEGWAASEPRGSGKAGADLRELLVELRYHGAKLRAGRQILNWGRADRINPTDVMAARDLRRLVVEDDENRLGQTVVSLAVPLAGGTVSAYWSPEFRPSELPIRALPIRRELPNARDGFAMRYERFGSGTDYSLTVARTPDHTPWLVPDTAQGPSALAWRNPAMWMAGGDFATTVGKFGLRVEAAGYWHDRKSVTAVADRLPRFAAVIGIDRNLPGEWLIVVQALVRISAQADAVPPALAALASRNAVIHGVWRDTVAGATLSVRKSFGSRSTAELTGAWLSGGGSYLQARTSLSLTGLLRLQLLGERYAGDSTSYFGRLRANNLVMIGLRAGF